LELTDPPEGFAVVSLERDGGGAKLILSVDKDKIKPGTKGNLVFAVYGETQRRGLVATSTQTARYFVGWLPAVPFVAVEQKPGA